MEENGSSQLDKEFREQVLGDPYGEISEMSD